MATLRSLRYATFAVAAALACSALTGALVVACSGNNDNPTPPTQNYNVEASTTVPDSSTGNEDETSTTNLGDGGTAADVREEPVPRDAACLIGRPAAQGAASSSTCWNCGPGINSDFLNQCAATGITCVPFDNARLPGYDGGALPPTQ